MADVQLKVWQFFQVIFKPWKLDHKSIQYFTLGSPVTNTLSA